MTDWAAWGTAVGTLALAGTTLVAVRSSNRSARIAEETAAAFPGDVIVAHVGGWAA